MNILVIGSGGREHAICQTLARSRRASRVFCAPGNAGIASVAECMPIKANDINALAEFAASKKIDLTFVGGETPLALGIVDEFEKRGLKIVGPTKAAARLEASKAFAKDFMARHKIPTARFETAQSADEAISILQSGAFGDENSRVVIKADGLAAGKGVVVAANRAQAIEAVSRMSELVGAAAAQIVIEECLVGREISLLAFCDGEHFALMPPTRDHKRIGEGDTGPNTGGMGAITDASLLSDSQTADIVKKIIRPTLRGCMREGFPFRGILFLGLMIYDIGSRTLEENAKARALARAKSTSNDPDIALTNVRASAINVLEYNVRFGDPETQSILVRLETDLVDICEAMLGVSSPTGTEGSTLADVHIKWKEGSSATVVLAAEGYPTKPRTGDVIHGVDQAAKVDDVTIFHAGTMSASRRVGIAGGDTMRKPARKQGRNTQVPDFALPEGQTSAPHTGRPDIVTSGGRVLGVTAVADDLDAALAKAYAAVDLISWEGMQYRRDIGK